VAGGDGAHRLTNLRPPRAGQRWRPYIGRRVRLGAVLRQRMQVSSPGDGDEVFVCSVRHGVLPTPCCEVDQCPEIRRPGEGQRLVAAAAAPLAPHGEHLVRERRPALEVGRLPRSLKGCPAWAA
jgi:hypothetical protein